MSKTTSPLAKAITTLEGQISAGLSVVLVVAGSPATHALNPKYAAAALVVNNLALIAQRGVLKAKALQSNPVVADLEDGDVADALKALEQSPPQS